MLSITLHGIRSFFRDRRDLALRQQLAVLQRTTGKPRLKNLDRGFWVLISRIWGDWRKVLLLVQLETVVRWHREGFRVYW